LKDKHQTIDNEIYSKKKITTTTIKKNDDIEISTMTTNMSQKKEECVPGD